MLIVTLRMTSCRYGHSDLVVLPGICAAAVKESLIPNDAVGPLHVEGQSVCPSLKQLLVAIPKRRT